MVVGGVEKRRGRNGSGKVGDGGGGWCGKEKRVKSSIKINLGRF